MKTKIEQIKEKISGLEEGMLALNDKNGTLFLLFVWRKYQLEAELRALECWNVENTN